MCEHKNFQVNARVGRLTESEEPGAKITEYRVDVEVHCMDCMMPFLWHGLPGGYSPEYPTTNVERTELRAPLKPVMKSDHEK